MTQASFRTLGVAVPWAMCTIVPSILFGVLLGQWGTNLIWGHVFGFGWFLTQSYFGPDGWRTAAGIGVLVWPPIVLLSLYWISGLVWHSGGQAIEANVFAVYRPIVSSRYASSNYRKALHWGSGPRRF